MKKLTYQYVKDFIESIKGYELLSKEYKNNRTKIDIQCPEGHKYNVSFNTFQRGNRCPTCFGTPKHKYSYIKDYIEQERYKLLSTEYINSKTKLKMQCPEGHKFKMRFNNFQNGQRCPYCAGLVNYTLQYVKNFIEAVDGYKLLSIEYINNKGKLKVQCPEGHKYNVSFNTFQRSNRCPICFGNKRLTYDHIKEFIRKEGYGLLSKKYKNNNTKLNIQCPEGHKFKSTFNSFQNGCRCPKCSYIDGQSKAEKEIIDIAKSFTFHNIIANDRTQIVNPKTDKYLELDIWIPSLMKAIEFNGIYWHSLSDVKYRDQVKKDQCLNMGIDLLVIKEQDWINNKIRCICYIGDFLNEEK